MVIENYRLLKKARLFKLLATVGSGEASNRASLLLRES